MAIKLHNFLKINAKMKILSNVLIIKKFSSSGVTFGTLCVMEYGYISFSHLCILHGLIISLKDC